MRYLIHRSPIWHRPVWHGHPDSSKFHCSRFSSLTSMLNNILSLLISIKEERKRIYVTSRGERKNTRQKNRPHLFHRWLDFPMMAPPHFLMFQTGHLKPIKTYWFGSGSQHIGPDTPTKLLTASTVFKTRTTKPSLADKTTNPHKNQTRGGNKKVTLYFRES